jgi:ElaA protein
MRRIVRARLDLMIVRRSAFADLDATTLYALLKLRSDVFVVEQECAYPELDGRDLEPTAEHHWVEADDGRPLAYLRVLDEGDGTVRVGRVVTDPSARSAGLARQLVEAVLAEHGDVRADAQSHLRRWYEALGFEVTGDEYVEDGIPHLPMRRTR